jgi:RNA polymerase sigma-B factor
MAPSSLSAREHQTEQLLSRLSRSHNSSQQARITGKIVELNLGVCDALANRYVHRGVERDDLVQVARLALIGAVQRFRFEAERPFLSFAVPTITGEIKRYFRDHSWMVRPPRSLQERRSKLTEVRRMLEQELGRPPRIDELAAATHHSKAEVAECLYAAASQRPLSMDAPLDGRDAEVTFGETLPVDDLAIELLPERLALQQALGVLTSKERDVIHWRFVEGSSQSEIGERMGVSQMQISRMLRAIVTRLKVELEM